MGVPLEQALERAGFTLGHFPSSILCSTVGGWVAARSAGQCSGAYGKIEDMVVVARVRHGRGRRRRAPPPDERARPRAARRRQRGDARHRDERAPAPPPGARVARLRRLVLSDHARRLGGDARALPGGPSPRGRAPLRPVRRDARQAGRREGGAAIDAPRGARDAPRSFGGTARCAPSFAARRRSTSCCTRASRRAPWAARCSSSSSRAAARARSTASTRARRLCESMGGVWEGESPARRWLAHRYSVSYRQAPVFAERRLRRHDGGRGALVEASASSTRACGARSASTSSSWRTSATPTPTGAASTSRSSGSADPGSRARARLGRGVRGDVRPRVEGGARRGGRGGRHARRTTTASGARRRRACPRSWAAASTSCARSCARSIPRGILNPGNLVPSASTALARPSRRRAGGSAGSTARASSPASREATDLAAAERA